MLFLLVIAIVATTAFYKRSQGIGAQTGKFASKPFLVLGILLVVGHVSRLLISWTSNALGISTEVETALVVMLNIFLLLTYVVVIKIYWVALNRNA